MSDADLDGALRVLAQWNMAPRAPTPECPVPERSRLDVGTSFVAEADGAVVGVAGYILLGEGRAETASLAVAPAWRGRGVGAALQRARLAEMKARGVTRVRTEADRPEVIRWYVRNFGYRIAGKTEKRHAFSLEDAREWTVLELELG